MVSINGKMFFSKRRVILIGVIAGLAGAIILTPLILTITLPPDISAVKINLNKVETKNPSPEEETSNLLNLDVIFKISNPTDKSLTTSKIEYTLFADGKSLGIGQIDYADIPVHGRPQLLAGSQATIRSPFQIPLSDPNLTSINIENISSSDIRWKVEGTAELESGFVTSPLRFSDELNPSS
jgi:LEA14-like dessication related protein